MLNDNFNKKWLEHLSNEVISGIQGNYLDAYVIALEGWRRGLTLKWHTKDSDEFTNIKTWYVDQPGQLFSLHSEKRSHYFFRTRGDLVTSDAVESGMNKETTKAMLGEAGIPVPEGKEFTNNASVKEVIKYIGALGFPVVIKPTDGSFGRGVFSDIRDEEAVVVALDYLYKELKETSIIVEKYIPGKDYRIYVVDNKVVGAILREPPNIKGDGKNNVETLIKIKNQSRQPNPRLSGCPITLNNEIIDYIKRCGYDLHSVPKKNEIVYLSDKGNVSIGGDPIDVLDVLSGNIKDIAVQALRAIPNLYHGAVDILSDNNKTGYVIALNPTAQIGGILFPISGSPRDIPKALIDFYFPETIGQAICYEMYFDHTEALLPLEKNMATETTVRTISPENIVKKEIVIKANAENLLLSQYLRKEGIAREFDGLIKQQERNMITLILAAAVDRLEEYINLIIRQHSHLEIIEINDYNKPIKTGFEIESGYDDIIKRLNHKKQKITTLRKEQVRLSKQYTNMLQSTSWKITKPLRILTGLLKK